MYFDTQNDRAVMQCKNSRTKVREFLRGEVVNAPFYSLSSSAQIPAKISAAMGQTTQEMSQRPVRKLTPR